MTGKKLSATTSVTVGGQTATFSVLSNQVVSVKVPALAAGTYPLVLTTAGGTAQSTVTYK